MPVLAQSMAQAQRYDWICSLMIISVDNLQDINDKYGWDAGDEILKAMAVSLNQMKRTADFLARVGEDDFCHSVTGNQRSTGCSGGRPGEEDGGRAGPRMLKCPVCRLP